MGDWEREDMGEREIDKGKEGKLLRGAEQGYGGKREREIRGERARYLEGQREG